MNILSFNMKPYPKTYRASKIHNAKECSTCAEEVEASPSPTRRESKRQINAEDLRPDNVAQDEHNENEDWYNFSEEYDGG